MIRIICWPVAKRVAGLKKAATATRPIRRYRRARRVSKMAGAVSVKTTARKLIWVCTVTGPLLVPHGSVGPLLSLPDSARLEPARVSSSIDRGIVGTTTPLALLPPDAGTDEPLFFTLPPWHEADFSLPPGTVEIVISPAAFAPVPDCCLPHPSLPQPGNPETPPQPVPEPRSLVLLGTALAATMLATMWRA